MAIRAPDGANNGRKITDVNFGINPPITIDNTVIYGKRWTKKAAKIKTIQPF